MPEMEVEYSREMRQNYLIIAMEGAGEPSFEARMMIGNTIEGLLKFRIKKTDNRSRFCYEITSKQPLSRLLETKTVNAAQIRGLLLGIARTLTRMEDYLLTEEQILFSPDFIYVDPEEYEPFLCLVPGRHGNFPQEFSRFLQYLLGKADHEDKEAVVLVYGLYRESLKENYGLDNLLRWLMKENYPKMGSSGPPETCETINEETTESWETEAEAGAEREKPLDSRSGIGRYLTPGAGMLLSAAASGLLLGSRGFWVYGVWLSLAGVLLLAGGTALWLKSSHDQSSYQQISHTQTQNSQLSCSQTPFSQTSFSEHSENQTNGMTSTNFPPQYSPSNESSGDTVMTSQWQMVFEEKPEEEISGQLQESRGSEMRTALLWRGEEEKETRSLVGEDGTYIPLSYYPFIIGKQEGLCDYVIAKSTVSRLHLRVDETEEGFQITDLNSTNGTFVNGRCLSANETAAVEPGDEIGIADLKFRLK